MSLYQTLLNLSDADIIQLFRTHQSTTAVLRHIGFKGNDPRALKFLSEKKLTLNVKDGRSGKQPAYTTDELRKVVKTSQNWSTCCSRLNITICSFNFKALQRRCRENNISTDHFLTSTKGSFKPLYSEDNAEDVLVTDSKISRFVLRSLLKRIGHYTGICAECQGNTTWNGKPLTLEVDHINGKSTDNRRINLRWLCPNCHSQTPTYRRGAKSKSFTQ